MNEEEKNIQNPDVQQSNDAIVNSIANSEARGEEKTVQGATQTKADFTAMFGVQSEETQEEKQLAKESTEIPRVLEVKDEDREVVVQISDEEKKSNHKKNFNSDERLIYQIEPDKTGNPLVVLLFFIALFGFMIALPKISKKVDFSQLFKTTPVNNNGAEEEESQEFYRIDAAASRAHIGDLDLINFVKSKKGNEYFFSFTIQNIGEKMYQFDKKYYIVLYSDESPLYYALIHSYNGIPTKSAQDVTLVISQRAYEKANRFKVEEIVESKYTDVNLVTTEGEYKVLTCRYLNDEMKYYFTDNQLIKIKETYKEESKTDTYESDIEKYRNLTEKYKKINSFNSIFIESKDDFQQINEIDLHTATDNEIIALKTYRFFSYRAHKNTVAFEIEAQGYTCS